MDAFSTCWTVIRSAAAGCTADRTTFARRYDPVVRAYLEARWHSTPMRQELEDAVQETFLECFRKGGVLDQVAQREPRGFQRFLKGVVRNVALRCESRRQRRSPALGSSSWLDGLNADEERLSHVFDRAWARTVLREAVTLLRTRAAGAGAAAQSRAELLHERFQEERPIREIARSWGEDAAVLHGQFRQARQEFREALLEVLRFHHPGGLRDPELELRELLQLLGRQTA